MQHAKSSFTSQTMNLIFHNLPITRIKLLIARVLYHLVKPIYGTKKRVISRNGLKFEVDIAEGLDLSLFLFGNFQRHVSDNKYVAFSPDDVILDVGANVGIMSLNFARKVPKGIVYAFEPTHYAWEKLKRNLHLNHAVAENIEAVHTFVSSDGKDADDIKAFSSWKIDKKISGNQHPVHGGEPMSTAGVPTITLDQFISNNKIDKVDFIKIDTDGHEFNVLLGAKKLLLKFRPKIIFELGQYVMEEHNILFSDYEQFFKALKYTLSDAANNKEITAANFKKRIPQQGTIDILAMPM